MSDVINPPGCTEEVDRRPDRLSSLRHGAGRYLPRTTRDLAETLLREFSSASRRLDSSLGDDTAGLLREVAARDLSMGRLLEGHVNATNLIRIWGSADVKRECARAVSYGHLFGVWGADDTPPVEIRHGRLIGAKRFASGLGAVRRAVVTAKSPEGQQLCVIEVDDPVRHDLSAWDMSGMQKSRSGRFDCTGLRAIALGPPNIYTAEPHFLGGTWRIAAVTLGGIVGLFDRASARLAARGHLDADAQLQRLGPLADRAVAVWPAICRAGAIADGPEGAADPERAATLSVSVRLLTEELAQDAIAAIERSVGLSMFSTADPLGRAARDLACYVRQAARDALQARTARAFLSEGSLGRWLDG